MEEQPKDQRRPIEIFLNQDMAYEIRLVRSDGKDSARCIVMGRSQTSVVNLSPGQYTIHLSQISDSPTRLFTNSVEITANTDTLDLSEIFQSKLDSDPRRSISTPDLGEMTEALRKSQWKEYTKSVKTGTVRREAFKFESLAVTRSVDPSSLLHPVHSPPKFEIGLSHNAATSSSGWQAAERLHVDLVPAYDGILEIVICDEDHGTDGPPRRVRLTLAIERRPAIRATLPLFRDGVRISIAPLVVNDETDSLIRIEAVNQKKQALVAALSSLSDDDAISVLNWSADTDGDDAMELLLYKKNDLWAATAAALLLARTYQLKRVAQWAYNLERLAPHISDAGVAAAWARATDDSVTIQESEQLTLNHLINSRRIGAPTFKVTHSIALELLNAIRGSSESAELREQARHEMSIWTRRASRRIFRGPYIMWEQAGEDLQRGLLPSERYLHLVSGRLKPDGFETDPSLLIA